jgi:hypothetical protein
MSQDEERQRRSRVVVETPTTRREEYVTQTRNVPGDRGGYSTGVVAAVALTAIALTALLVFFFMNNGTDATQTNVNVTAAATPIPTIPTPLPQQPMQQPQPPIIIQQPPAASQPAPVIVPPPAGATSSAPAPNPANDDSAIETRVNKALTDDTNLASLGITVTVVNGKAMLNGLVKTADLKAHAEQVAKAVRGVRSVDNKIIVEGQ